MQFFIFSDTMLPDVLRVYHLHELFFNSELETVFRNILENHVLEIKKNKNMNEQNEDLCGWGERSHKSIY